MKMFADRDGLTLVALQPTKPVILQTAEGLKRVETTDWLLYPPGAVKPLAMPDAQFKQYFIPLED